jgi:hypothetical protein
MRIEIAKVGLKTMLGVVGKTSQPPPPEPLFLPTNSPQPEPLYLAPLFQRGVGGVNERKTMFPWRAG